MLARTERLDAARLNRAFEATHTTSPTGSIVASIDAARALLARDGERLCGRLLRGVAAARRRLREVPGLDVLDGPTVEPTKLIVLLAGTGANGYAVEADLIRQGMPMEMADRDTLGPIPTIADDEAQIAAFTEALIATIERHRGTPRQPVAAAGLDGAAADGDGPAGGVLRGQRDGQRGRGHRPGQRGADRAVPARGAGAGARAS